MKFDEFIPNIKKERHKERVGYRFKQLIFGIITFLSVFLIFKGKGAYFWLGIMLLVLVCVCFLFRRERKQWDNVNDDLPLG